MTWFLNTDNLDKIKEVMNASNVIEESGFLVRTKRVCFENRLWDKDEVEKISRFTQENDIWGFATNFDDSENSEQISSARNIIKYSENGFVNFSMMDDEGIMNTNAIEPFVDLINEVGEIGNGIDNFRLGASFGLESATPFFPYSKNNGKESFAIGLEYIDLIHEILEENNRESLETIRINLKRALIEKFNEINSICLSLSNSIGVEFLGIDLSIAPYPYPLEEQSVVDIIETLGNIGRSRGEAEFKFGMNGTLFFHTYLTGIIKSIIKEGQFTVTGFNGIMYSVLEDTRLSQRYAEGNCNINDLLLTSTTCGCGIDMLPVMTYDCKKRIGSMIMDLYALSVTLNKPLGIRILPITNSRAGDWTRFKHLFFTNTMIRDHGTGIGIQKLPNQISKPKINLRRD